MKKTQVMFPVLKAMGNNASDTVRHYLLAGSKPKGKKIRGNGLDEEFGIRKAKKKLQHHHGGH